MSPTKWRDVEGSGATRLPPGAKKSQRGVVWLSFTGEFRHTIDAKGRLIVPSRMRDELSGEDVVLTRWLEDCIALWSQQGWHEMEVRLREAGSSSRDARNFVRMVSSSAHIDEVDKQGRITVP